MMSSPNTIRFNARVKSQRKTLIILLLIAMGLTVAYFVAVHIEMTLRLETIDGKVKEAIDILDEVDLALVIECLSLLFVMKLDRLGIFIFAWVELSYLALMSVGIFFMVTPHPVVNLDSHGTPKKDPYVPSVIATVIYIAILIMGLTSVIVSILKIIFMFKLAKSLKRQSEEELQQQLPLI